MQTDSIALPFTVFTADGHYRRQQFTAGVFRIPSFAVSVKLNNVYFGRFVIENSTVCSQSPAMSSVSSFGVFQAHYFFFSFPHFLCSVMRKPLRRNKRNPSAYQEKVRCVVREILSPRFGSEYIIANCVLQIKIIFSIANCNHREIE